MNNKKIVLLITGAIRYNDQDVPDYLKEYSDNKDMFDQIMVHMGRGDNKTKTCYRVFYE